MEFDYKIPDFPCFALIRDLINADDDMISLNDISSKGGRLMFNEAKKEFHVLQWMLSWKRKKTDGLYL